MLQELQPASPPLDASMHWAFGTMAALEQRCQTGKGQMVTGALLATANPVTNGFILLAVTGNPLYRRWAS